MNDFKISGSGQMIGGEYGNVRISGSCKIAGDIMCESMHVSGSAKSESNIVCKSEMHVSGSFKGNDISCAELKVSGASKFGNVKGGSVKISGALKASAVEADNAYISGGVKIDGLLNAENINIECDDSEIGSIGCTRLEVNQHGNSGKAWFGIFKVGHCRALKTDVIEGDKINICYTEANVVRGKDVVIGKGCKIGKVEYTGTCSVDANAEVGELIDQSEH